MANLRRYCGPYILTIEGDKIKEYCGRYLYEIQGDRVIILTARRRRENFYKQENKS